VSIKQLYELQTLEEAIVSQEQVLAQAQSHLGESPALKYAKTKLAEARIAMETAAREQRATEAAIADLTSKMTAAGESLYSGRIKNPKELQNLQRELEILQAQCDPLEEKDLNLMEKIEAWQTIVKQRAAELAIAETTWQDEQACLLHEIEAAKQVLAELRVKHDQLLPNLPAADLKLYTQTKQMHGQAVARVVQGTCGKCRLNLSSAENQRVHSGQTVSCSSCGRLLFFE
jgi:uncharacterized protein